jgi:hypothetical protein
VQIALHLLDWNVVPKHRGESGGKKVFAGNTEQNRLLGVYHMNMCEEEDNTCVLQDF